MLTIGQSQTSYRWHRQEQCHQAGWNLPTGTVELKEVVLQLPAVFLWKSIRAGRMPHVKWWKMVNLFSLSLCIIVPCFRNRAAKLRRILLMTYILSVCRPMIYVYLWIILEVSMIFILAFSSFFAVVWLLGKGITKNESQSCWFPFSHVCDLKIVSLVSFLEEIEPTNRFIPARRLSAVELSLASAWCGWPTHACSHLPCLRKSELFPRSCVRACAGRCRYPFLHQPARSRKYDGRSEKQVAKQTISE